jgi:Repeat of unknown function (DUF346)
MLHVFYRDQHSTIKHVWRRGPQYVHDTWPVADESARPVSSLTALGGLESQHVFYRDSANLIRHIWWSQGGGFKHDTWPIAEGAVPASDFTAMHKLYDNEHEIHTSSTAIVPI